MTNMGEDLQETYIYDLLNAQQISGDTCISCVLRQAPLIKLFGNYKCLTKDQLDEVTDLSLDLENFGNILSRSFTS
ncbi:hypothetical protein HYN43_003220 [Mucilaginibacter celer]|uniref:Uncharacterized protein n=1 Tax=Mucilaginibacter celer TaxID=2305508 RepID=A0A494VHU7_9SPHI|nr:hypothetical protein HYN43_003220 [Mucilaginibacter celer]